jgi:riboflavin transporter FmnP
MNTKALAASIVFAALTVALNPAISGIGILAPYAPYLIYGLWEIPIVAAFLLIGSGAGILIAILNSLVLFAFFPGALPSGPFYNLIAIFSMMLGVYVGRRFFTSKAIQTENVIKIVAASTILGIVLRVAVMTVVNYVTLPQGYPIGFGLDELAVITLYLPSIALFNATVVLYTVPLGEFISDVVKSRTRFKT